MKLRMRVIHFAKEDQEKTEAFLNNIYQEMGWVDQGGELTNLYQYFYLPDGEMSLRLEGVIASHLI